jgi:copper chaperone CopZ
VKAALEGLPGVTGVDTDCSTQTATVTCDVSEFQVSEAIAALDQAGYGNSSVQ